MKYNHNEVFGYAPVDHKESLRFITADRLKEQPMAPGIHFIHLSDYKENVGPR